MWLVLTRTRDRLMHAFDPGATVATAGTITAPALGMGTAADPATAAPDLVLTMGRVDLERLVTALQALLGPDVARPDTPARLEVALAAAIQLLGGDGRPRVTRRPPGLYTPEAWQVRIPSIDPAVSDAIRGAARGLGFSR